MSSSRPGIDIALADGTPVWVRPVVASDRGLLREGIRAMSRTTRYLRFFTAGEMSEENARYFTEIDQETHVAFCGVAPDNLRGYGIARFIRDADSPETAEFAVAVIDEIQGRGLGTILLASIYVIAQRTGIREFRGEMLPDNPVMPIWMPQLGADILEISDIQIIRWPIVDAIPTDTPTARRFMDWVRRMRAGQ
jgi:acetyltransferase